ncbi:nucleoside 2-deoxyribosyltransferase-like protein [Methanohalophilus euhalobius]|jgi:nucleoside 2-deoxyribosyltransferase|uniref:Nucleoside 2-deoxyribosyltransferase n=1 Tax=Methanohalophilus euhalobius TaxID=51203 RepID=A0A285G7J0_9EURY|nr:MULTISPECIES: nucleoside 2-deoxyribosyltransferase [Methanohalophilus]RSD36236.1 MAG: nucleoside 2-deoxyribosyltransferase [Methanohalophilus sp.]ODV49272.1 MAG: nucleoside 2-deoxyribosyltransferase [Methanohalophilus sp. 2-GBenrich]RXG34932.1 nucleoside 2-deoxyribosyltransferase [Methanohalophilus sp. WG1-DM]TCL12424.1 nucleoside 2-deoxyribosyltransferase-like protein [Methanohalophilus euhalobius]SNY19074.1 Nucleoside 2-deoxyribosyltransferase [Methanohalophilus euhalobius]
MNYKEIYLAGPLFSEAEKNFNEQLTEKIESAGYDVFLPQRDSTDTKSMRKEQDAAELFRRNSEAIDRADLVIAILDGGSDVDSGTAWEIGYAYAKNIPVMGMRTDFRTLGIEGTVNLMIEKTLIKLVYSTDKLLTELENMKR